jgi:hypothetical protein
VHSVSVLDISGLRLGTLYSDFGRSAVAMDQAAIQRICPIASSTIVARSIAHHVDNFTSSAKSESVYTTHHSRPNSAKRAMATSLILASICTSLLETCHLIYSEAHQLASNEWYFHVLYGPHLIKRTPSRRKWSSWQTPKQKK